MAQRREVSGCIRSSLLRSSPLPYGATLPVFSMLATATIELHRASSPTGGFGTRLWWNHCRQKCHELIEELTDKTDGQRF